MTRFATEDAILFEATPAFALAAISSAAVIVVFAAACLRSIIGHVACGSTLEALFVEYFCESPSVFSGIVMAIISFA